MQFISFIASYELPYQKYADLGWVFAEKRLGPQEPRLFASRQYSEPLEIAHPEFQLSLGEGWRRFPDDDPERFAFHSASRKTSVVLSVAMHPVVSRDRLLGIANKLAEVRVQAEQDARPDSMVKVTSCNVELKDDGHLGFVVYAGYDERAIFRFMGWVTQRKVLSLWVSTETRDNEYSKAMFGEVFAGLRFHLP